MGQNDVGRERDQFCRVSANVGSIGGGPARVDADVAADGPSHQSQSLMERCEASLKYRIVCGGGQEHADAPDAIRLLRPCRQRPRGRAAEQRDELASPYIEMHLLPQPGTPWAAYRIGEDQVRASCNAGFRLCE